MPKIPTLEKATVIYHCFETLTSHHFGSIRDETCCHLVRKSQPLKSCETQPRLPNKTFIIPTILKNKYTEHQKMGKTRNLVPITRLIMK